jgi:ABC-type phosphate/phosphonate transport system substrate-binding protein
MTGPETPHGLDWGELGLGAAIASLPMYDLPELREANDALWAALRARLLAQGVDCLPRALTREPDLDAIWNAPNLLVAQTCGYPFMTRLRHRVRLVATPRYLARGCDGPFHRAAIVVRKGSRAQSLADLRGLRLAFNAPDSNTGVNLLRAELAQVAHGAGFFAATVSTGSHADSAAAVAEGRADVASIDCVTWAFLQRLRPALTERLAVLAWTARSPGLPLVTSRLTDRTTFTWLRQALDELARDPGLAPLRRELLLDGFHSLPEPHYRTLLYFEQMAASLGYAQLN